MLEAADRLRALEILLDQRRHLLSSLTTRSPLLKFTPTRGDREDVTGLFAGIQANAPATTPQSQGAWMPVTTPNQLLEALLSTHPRKSEIRNVAESVLAKCGRIIEHGRDWHQQTGQHSVFIGYPLVFYPLDKTRFVLAPLYLWSIELQLTRGNKLRVARLSDDEDPVPPVFNRLFKTWLQNEKNLQLYEQPITWERRATVVREVFRDCPAIASSLANELRQVPDGDSLKEQARSNESPRVLPCAILGHAPFKGQARLDDLDNIIASVETGATDLGVLTRFVSPGKRDSGESKTSIPPLSDQWLVSDTDNSQEESIWQARNSPLTVVHGPPGTGKSQTIVNLIADALKHGKKVLVVCEKAAALEVIRKRLEKANLADLAIQINEAGKDRSITIKRIRAEEFDWSSRLPQIKRICEELHRAETDLYKVQEVLSGPEGEPYYGNLLARLSRLDISGIDRSKLKILGKAASEITDFDWEQLELTLEEISRIKDDMERCDYIENPWRSSLLDVVVDGVTLLDLREDLTMLLTTLENSLQTSLLYRKEHSWIAEHPMARLAHGAFLSPETKKFYEQQLIASQVIRDLPWTSNETKELMLPRDGDASRASKVVRTHLEFVSTITSVINIRRRIEGKALLRELWGEFLGYFDRWEHLVAASALRRWLSIHEQGFTLPPTVAIESQRKELGVQTLKKQSCNVETIRRQFADRFSPRSTLVENKLTRLRANSIVQRTELRDIFDRGFDSFHKLYPVLLTNPDTACTILPLKPQLYDLLIMDEASQVFMADAIPLLYRAGKVVVSGDQHQMPPSDYFMQGVADGFDEEEEETEEDSGSNQRADENRLVPAEGEYCLLDAAVFAVHADRNANRYLRIHYRSDFPELINFSNHAFYESRLFAPPGNQQPLPCCPTPIVMKKVGGDFHKGENKIEALAVLGVLKDILESDSPPSIGIITFNVKQRDLIDEVLFEEGEKDEAFRQRLESAKQQCGPDGDDQSLFVRSVEHVQGDERELIIFSTTYDAQTRNYGPLSILEKGRKRLNVAITRAKKGVILLTSMDIERVSSESERNLRERYYLWKYLRYAQAISQQNVEEAEAILASLSESTSPSTRSSAESPFEDDVADFLRQHYHVDYQIGAGGFRIDLGVKLKKEDARYLVGIECDGRRWHSSWTARMNDVWRQKILENKGWKIERVWSTDWYNDTENTKSSLLARIRSHHALWQ